MTRTNQIGAGALQVRAKVLGDVPIKSVEIKLGNTDRAPMMPVPGEPALWQANCDTPCEPIRVRARDSQGRHDEDRIDPAPAGDQPPNRNTDGSDRHRIGAWLEKAIPGPQLGPNRNGRHW